jgi:hypothetical protein
VVGVYAALSELAEIFGEVPLANRAAIAGKLLCFLGGASVSPLGAQVPPEAPALFSALRILGQVAAVGRLLSVKASRSDLIEAQKAPQLGNQRGVMGQRARRQL